MMQKTVLGWSVFSTLLALTTQTLAYDSLACGPGAQDCEGLKAARTPWVVAEHAQLWMWARDAGGLPALVDEPFEVTTWTMGDSIENFDALRSAPLDQARDSVSRSVEIPVFAQLPDKSYSLWDWTSGNEGCPPLGNDTYFPECHGFKAHMGWLNSNHFMPQSKDLFFELHASALEHARYCKQLEQELAGTALHEEILMQCDRQALLFEAVAHHYLQDAWSMGHMWQRWGSPEYFEFEQVVSENADVPSVLAVGDSLGRAAGIIHGARAITTLPDAMCTPDDGVQFSYFGELIPGGGDLYLEEIQNQPHLERQKTLMMQCFTTALREVYQASSQSLGPLSASAYPQVDLDRCFTQRATNRALALGAAVQVDLSELEIPEELIQQVIQAVSDAWKEHKETIAAAGAAATAAVILAPRVVVQSALVAAGIAESTSLALLGQLVYHHLSYLASIGINPVASEIRDNGLYVPLSSPVLHQLNFLIPGEFQVAKEELIELWKQDMARINAALVERASTEPEGTQLADGGMGDFLGMGPNGSYSAADLSYRDPLPPYTPTEVRSAVSPIPLESSNIMARTFVEANISPWCSLLEEGGNGEFSLLTFQARCSDPSLSEEVRENACDLCESFAQFFVVPEERRPGAELSVCQALAGKDAIEVEAPEGNETARELANTWCDRPVESERIHYRVVTQQGSLVYYHVYSSNLDGSGEQQISSNDTRYVRHVSVLPELNRLAYIGSVYIGLDFVRGAYQQEGPGGTPYILKRDARTLSIARDVQQVSFTLREDSNDYIYVMNFDRSEERPILSEQYISSTALSPDGRYLAYGVADGLGSEQVHLYSLETNTKLGPISAVGDGSTQMSWAPDSRRLAYTVNDTVYIYDVRDLSTRRLSVDTQYHSHPSWSPDGTQMALAIGGDIWVTNLDGSELYNLTNTPERGEDEPVWYY